MFIPEPGDHFHIYDEERGLLRATVFQCGDRMADPKLVMGVIVAGQGRRGERHLFQRGMVSFWPVQPGYRQHLQGQSFPMERDGPANPQFVQQFKTMIGIRS
jgi:hypothetical protein